MIRLFVTVEDVDAVIAAGFTVIRVYTDTSESGDFTTLDGTITLVASTESYLYTDVDATAATWYKTAYFGASPGESSKSAARKGETSAAYATVVELRGQINKTKTTTDVELALLLDAVSDSIDKFCNRSDGFVSDVTESARTYTGSGSTVQWIDECTAVTLVEVKDSPSDTTYDSWVAADWIAATGDPENPDFNRTPFHFLVVSAVGDFELFTSGTFSGRQGFRRMQMGRGVPTVRITGNWGYAATVPGTIKEATIAQAARWYKRGQGAWSNILANREQGQLAFGRSIQASLDPDIRFMLVGSRLVVPALGRR